MEIESGLLLGAITALSSALVYLYRRSEATNASIKADLDACLERERERFLGRGKKDDDESK